MTERIRTMFAYTPYVVMPRLAIEAMPDDWQERFADLIDEAYEAGLETPGYFVFRDVDEGGASGIKGCRQKPDDTTSPFYRLTGGWETDPWADYKYGDVSKLCPKFTKPEPVITWAERVSDAADEVGRDLTLEELLHLAKSHVMTPAEIETRRDQIRAVTKKSEELGCFEGVIELIGGVTR